MIDYSCIYIYSDISTACPKCGIRSDIIMDLGHTVRQTQIHLCPNKRCDYEFIMQYDADFDNGSLL